MKKGTVVHIMKYKKRLIFAVLSVFFSLFTQILVGDPNYDRANGGVRAEIVSSSGYEINQYTYSVTSNDPQMYLDFHSTADLINVKFSEPLDDEMLIQVYYSQNGTGFSESNSTAVLCRKGKQNALLDLPYSNYDALRVDLGSKVGESFKLEEISVFTSKLPLTIRLDICSTIFLSLAFYFTFYFLSKYKTNESKKERLFILFSFSLFFLWSVIQPFNACPDELMRYDVVRYVFENNRLPHGGDPNLLNPTWGLSYGFTPYLSGMLSAGFMKIASIITTNEWVLITAARFVSVCAGTISVYFIIKIANEVFENTTYKWLFIIGISCVPQYVFLGSYMNNDMMSLMSVAMILFFWIVGLKTKWDKKSLVGLAVSLSICILSYYNAYGYVLMSIVLFIVSCNNMNLDSRQFVKKFSLVFLITFILAGWFFVRNAVMYDGDFLGLKTSREYSEVYAINEFKPSMRGTPSNQGLSLGYMLLNMKWLESTYKSFVGIFGYMSISISNWMYIYYAFFFGFGLTSYVLFSVSNAKKKGKVEKTCSNKNQTLFDWCLFISGLIAVLLSVYYSYNNDFQPQGRYIMSCIYPLVYFTVKGFHLFFEKIKRGRFYISRVSYIFIVLNITILLLSTKYYLIDVYM